jgi:hypothetical protein
MSIEDGSNYEVGYGKAPIATRFKKGQVANPAGRPPKEKTPPELDLGKILQEMDNEARMIVVDGKRMSMRLAEIHFRQLFAKSIKGDLTAARLIAKMAAEYFGPEAEGPGETRFIVKRDKGESRQSQRKARAKKSKARRRAKRTQQQVSAGVLFRKVAREEVTIEIDGQKRKISHLHAYVRQIYLTALNKNNTASRLLEQLRRLFPGDLPTGDPITFIIRPSDEDL